MKIFIMFVVVLSFNVFQYCSNQNNEDVIKKMTMQNIKLQMELNLANNKLSRLEQEKVNRHN